MIIRDDTNSRTTSKRNTPNRSAMPIQPNPNFEACAQRRAWRGQGHFSNRRCLRLRFRKSREQAGSDGNAAAAFSNFPLTASNAKTNKLNKLKNENLLISGQKYRFLEPKQELFPKNELKSENAFHFGKLLGKGGMRKQNRRRQSESATWARLSLRERSRLVGQWGGGWR